MKQLQKKRRLLLVDLGIQKEKNRERIENTLCKIT